MKVVTAFVSGSDSADDPQQVALHGFLEESTAVGEKNSCIQLTVFAM